MTHITFFKNSEKEITGFYSAGMQDMLNPAVTLYVLLFQF